MLFGGWSGSHAENETWVFQNGTWTNVTVPGDSPPARFGASMAYDGEFGAQAVVLFGGCDPHVACPRQDTWLYSNGSWRNIAGAIGPMPGVWDAAMTTWGSNGTVLFGGCRNLACDVRSNGTWAFQNSSVCGQTYPQSCWTNLTSTLIRGSSPPPLAGAGLGDDPQVGSDPNGEIVLYGGSQTPCPGCLAKDSNATWLFDGGRWTNATGSYATGAYPRAGRSNCSLFWDPATGSMWLYGGTNDSTGSEYDQLWMTDVLAWSNQTAPAAVGPPPVGSAAVSGVAGGGPASRPLLVGGVLPGGGATNATWVFEPSIVSATNIAPNPLETNGTAHFFSNTTGGTDPGVTWSLGDGSSWIGNNGTHVYSRAGNYTVFLTARDWYGVVNTSFPIRLTVRPFSLGLAIPGAVDAYSPAVFSVNPANGTAPYNVTWTFPGGNTSYGAAASHTFSAIGSASVGVAVRDATGTLQSVLDTIQVNPPLSGQVQPSLLTMDAGTSASFAIQPQGGTPPYVSLWTLPDGRDFVGSNVTYRPTVAGAVDVTVLLRDGANATWSDRVAVQVNSPLTFTASASEPTPTSGRSVSFSARVTGGSSPYTYSWHFGDGSTSPAATPTHEYGGPGTYQVTVWVNDSGGGSFRQSLAVKVPRSAGGLLWQILLLPLGEKLVVAGASVGGVLLLGAVAYRRTRGRAGEGGRPRIRRRRAQFEQRLDRARRLTLRLRTVPKGSELERAGRRTMEVVTGLLRSERIPEADAIMDRLEELLERRGK